MRHLALLVVCFSLFFLVGCGQHLGGTNDMALDYRIDLADLGPKAPKTAEEWRPAVEKRLSSAEVFADVDALGPDAIRITVDADESDFADQLVRWRGGVMVYAIDPSFLFTPPDTTGLSAKRDGDEQYWVGPLAPLRKAVSAAPQPADHRILIQRVDATSYRTRAVSLPAVFDLSSGLKGVGLTDRGRAIEIVPTPEAQAKLREAAVATPGAKMAVVRDTSILAVVATDDLTKQSIVVSYGKDIVAYTTAKAVEQVLLSDTLPPMTRTASARVAPRWTIAILCLVLPMLISFGWLFFVRSFDRARPEPMWLVITTFVLGGLSCVPAAFAEAGLSKLSPYLDPRVATMGGQWFALPLALPVFFLCVGVVEEGGKFLGAWTLARHRREFDEPVDGIVYGCAAALGFAAVENIEYFTSLRLETNVVAARAFMSVPAHMFFGALWGYALGRKLVRKKTSVLLFFFLAALAHASFDTFLSLPGGFLISFALMGVLSLAFMAMLRAALRHGAVPPKATEEPESRARVTFTVGSPLTFFFSGGSMVVLAAVLVIAGAAYEHAHRRANFVFLAFVTFVLSAFGLAIYVVATAIPLDVVLDANGVTFAGARTPWTSIRSLETRHVRGAAGHRGWLTVRTPDGPLRIGPAPSAKIEEIARAIDSYLLSRAPRDPVPFAG